MVPAVHHEHLSVLEKHCLHLVLSAVCCMEGVILGLVVDLYQMNICTPVSRGWCQQLAGGCWMLSILEINLYNSIFVMVEVEYLIICLDGWSVIFILFNL